LQAASEGRLQERFEPIIIRLQDIHDENRLKSWSISLATYYVAVQGYSVGFEKFELLKWDYPKFIEYCTRRGIVNSKEVYRNIRNKTGIEHPLPTRAVLVQKLADLISEYPNINELLDNILNAGTEFFSIFVRSLLDREATEKWLNRSGEQDIGTPLLSINEHILLLSDIALSMC
jgi:hypothetical protein